MKAYLADAVSDEEVPQAEEGKTVYIQGSKQSLLELCSFFPEVAQHLKQNDTCHMHFQDDSKMRAKETHIDVSVGLDEDT